jgi:hypothetical protein
VFITARLALKPRKIPNAVHLQARKENVSFQMTDTMGRKRSPAYNCQHITRPPRMAAGVFSAQNIGMVDAFIPIPRPRSKRVMKSCGQVWAQAPPIGERTQKMADKKMAPRRPRKLFSGSEHQQPKTALAIYGALFPVSC